MTILDEIRAHKEEEVAARQARRPLGDLIGLCGRASKGAGFADSLRAGAGEDGIALIAEVKRRSPAAGHIRPDADAVDLASSYVAGGAGAISILTDEKFFAGTDDDFQAIRERLAAPLLRKDFTIASYQIYEARALGADAVLLIVSMLRDEELNIFLDTADCLGMDAVVEAHSEDEVRRAVALRAPIIGINNRDLATFTVDLATTERLRPLIPPSTVVISESGIGTRADVERMQAAGAQAILVGEALVRSQDPAAKVRELLGKPASAPPLSQREPGSTPLPLGEAGRIREAGEDG